MYPYARHTVKIGHRYEAKCSTSFFRNAGMILSAIADINVLKVLTDHPFGQASVLHIIFILPPQDAYIQHAMF
jgi:hypothetical protein